MERFKKLRQKHPRFIYQSFDFFRKKNLLFLKFNFLLEPDIIFTPSLEIPLQQDFNEKFLVNFVFHLGLIEALSYWKAACPSELLIEAGSLTAAQRSFWHDLYLNGLGEFFYVNRIDFTAPDLLRIKTSSSSLTLSALPNAEAVGNLILCDGGKDSAVTLESLKTERFASSILMLNPRPSAYRVATEAGFKNIIVVKRTIDKKLLELNHAGYLNGHTPFSAYLAFLGVLTAFLYKKKHVIVSNERSSSEGNTKYHGKIVNHQYSKSYTFEKKFRNYCRRYLSDQINYFSFLRPLFELKIIQLFSKLSSYHQLFLSCNLGAKDDKWCGKCGKCAFIYLSLAAFLSQEKMLAMFGSDFFKDSTIVQQIKALVGLSKVKPFECVGTVEESRLALLLTEKKYRKEKRQFPKSLQNLVKKLAIEEREFVRLKKKILSGWSNRHFLSPKFEKILLRAL